MRRAYYDSTIPDFVQPSEEQVLGELAIHHGLALEPQQRNAWRAQIAHLQQVLRNEK